MSGRPAESEQMSKTARIVEMAWADQGVCAADVKREFACGNNQASALIVRAALHGDLVRARSHRGKYHYFHSHKQRATWLRGEETALAQAVARKREQKVMRERARAARQAAPAPTVYVRPPKDGHVEIMADALPGVPGWRSGPVIRPGALDYTRYQTGNGGTLYGALR